MGVVVVGGGLDYLVADLAVCHCFFSFLVSLIWLMRSWRFWCVCSCFWSISWWNWVMNGVFMCPCWWRLFLCCRLVSPCCLSVCGGICW